MQQLSEQISFEPYLKRYRAGTWRDRILHDLILEDAQHLGDNLTFVDIGCGMGFDGDIPLQQSLARAAGHYIGIEPDTKITPGAYIQDVRRCFFEECDLPSESVHVAFSVMVLEHLPKPRAFWDKLHDVLVPGGVFWATTVDARHWFRNVSMWFEKLKVKDWYLDRLLGRGGEERYENYPTHYKCNSPEQVQELAKAFSSVTCQNFSCIGQVDPVLPGFLRPLSRRLEARAIHRGKPGTLMVIRAVK